MAEVFCSPADVPGGADMTDGSGVRLQGWIEAMNAGDDAALGELLAHTSERLRRLTRRLLPRNDRLRRWEDSGDVSQEAFFRLRRTLLTIHPATEADFFRLATREIRRVLIDLARHYFGPQGPGTLHESNGPAGEAFDLPAESTCEPGRLDAWTELHRRVEALPQEQRDVFELHWYHGLSQDRAAEVLGVSVPTVTRRWREAQLELAKFLEGEGGFA
jgi:RNA polymerase sigma-70 factor (ECF subfamily)